MQARPPSCTGCMYLLVLSATRRPESRSPPFQTAIGFNIESIQINNAKIQVWDLGGQTAIRPYWRCYYAKTDGVVFVVDSADKDRMSLARNEFKLILAEEELAGVPVLVIANKKDDARAVGEAELSQLLDLGSIHDRPWSVRATSAISGEGLDEAFKWLTLALCK